MNNSVTQPRAPVYQNTYDSAAIDQPTRAVVEAIATLEDVSPLELPPLYECIDPDALNQVFTDVEAKATETLTITFTVGDWSVHIDATGRVSVYDLE